MDREQIDSLCEKAILGLVLAILLLTPLALGAVRSQEFLVVQWLVVAILAVWLVRFAANPKHRLLWVPMCWPVLGFMIYAVGRAWTSDIEFLGRQEMIRVLVYGAIFFAVVNNLHRQETTQILGLSLIALAMLLSVYAVFQFLTGSDEVFSLFERLEKPEGYRKRASATFYSPNHLAGYLEIVLPLALTFTMSGRFTPVQKIFLGYASLVIFAGISVTISRGGWLACGVSLLALFFYLVRQRDYWKRALLVLAALGAIFVFFFLKAEMSPDRVERFVVASRIEDVRIRLWAPTVAMWQDHVAFGVGPNHFDQRFNQYRPADPGLQARPERAHNDYLNTLADWGLVGGVLVLGCWVTFFVQVFRSWKHVQRTQNDLGAKRSNKAAFVLGGSLGLLAILVHSVFDFNMHIPSNAILTVVILALVGAHYRFATERHWHTVRLGLRIPVTLLLAALLGYVTWQSVQRTRETWALVRARASTATQDDRLRWLKQAAAIEPKNAETAYAIGEELRQRSSDGGPEHVSLAREAIEWFRRAAALNPYDSMILVRLGMSLDWLADHQAAGGYFEAAQKLDPHGYLTLAYLGWHKFQEKDYAGARRYFEQSMGLVADAAKNPIASNYLKLMNEREKDGGLER